MHDLCAHAKMMKGVVMYLEHGIAHWKTSIRIRLCEKDLARTIVTAQVTSRYDQILIVYPLRIGTLY